MLDTLDDLTDGFDQRTSTGMLESTQEPRKG